MLNIFSEIHIGCADNKKSPNPESHFQMKLEVSEIMVSILLNKNSFIINRDNLVLLICKYCDYSTEILLQIIMTSISIVVFIMHGQLTCQTQSTNLKQA